MRFDIFLDYDILSLYKSSKYAPTQTNLYYLTTSFNYSLFFNHFLEQEEYLCYKKKNMYLKIHSIKNM